MKYQPFQLYHIYNQGNNRQKIFFSEENYRYFKKKIKKYICSNAELLAYCLMPNHFHLLIYTKSSSIQPYKSAGMQSLSFAISQLLSSYTKAINLQENRTGSLFRSKTKANDGWDNDPDYTSIEYFDGERVTFIDNWFAQNVFRYIHENPVKAGLVPVKEHWRYSSVSEYLEVSQEPICNIKLGRELIGLSAKAG
ncbi:MAG: transposase [Saprospiraceae bacterium]|nr:transposase [Saprospiraceae bacterium]